MQGMQIEVGMYPLEKELWPFREELYRVFYDALRDHCKGKEVSVRVVLEALTMVQFHTVIHAAKCNQQDALGTIISSIATFHAHNTFEGFKDAAN